MTEGKKCPRCQRHLNLYYRTSGKPWKWVCLGCWYVEHIVPLRPQWPVEEIMAAEGEEDEREE